MDILFSLLDNTYVLVGLGLVVALVLYQKFAPRMTVRVPGVGLSGDELAGRLLGPRWNEAKLERAVARERKLGNHLAAGRLYENAHKDGEAVEAYLAGQELHAAATVLERTGRLERAAELYLQSGDFKKAAQVFTEAGLPARAAELFLERKNTIEAARLFAVAQKWDRAADLYLKGGYPLRAAEAFEKHGELRRAAECYEKHFDENVTYATTYSSTAQSADHKAALLAGRLFERAGDPQRAHQAYAKGSYFKEAAGASMQAGQYARAAELFLRAEDPEHAAQACEQAGDVVRAANLRGEVALKADRVAEAAAYFQQGQDYLRAAELFESVGRLADAAAAFEAGNSHAAAGGVYLRAGLKERAAPCYEQAREYETAAKLYEEIGDTRKAAELYAAAGLTFKSGEAAMRAGDRERAIGLLQQVPAGDENHRAATELLAGLFIAGGMAALAIERVSKALRDEPVAVGNLDLYYWLGAAHEAGGDAAAALEIYQKILAENLTFRDVPARVAHLQGGSPGGSPPLPLPRSMPAAPVPATGPPSPPPAGEPAPAVAASAAPEVRKPAMSGGASAPTAAPTPAARPRFVPREQVGRGPLGPLHRGEDASGRSYALRLLAPETLAAAGGLPALAADLKVAAQVVHANVARVLGLVELDGRRAVVSEWVVGRSLADPLAAGQRLPWPQALALARLLLQALGVVHGQGQVHGSVQPSNVMLAGGSVKLTDLGLGRLRHAFPNAYRAPEAQLDAAGDLYAGAALVYHALTGAHPASLPQGAALPLPSSRVPEVPEGFDAFLLRALHPHRDLRPPRAEDGLALLAMIAGRP